MVGGELVLVLLLLEGIERQSDIKSALTALERERERERHDFFFKHISKEREKERTLIFL